AQILSECPLPAKAGLPPFQGGIAGLFGYDLAHAFEKLPRPANKSNTPDLAVGVYDWVISWDHQENRAWIVSSGAGDWERAAKRIAQVTTWQKHLSVRCSEPAGLSRRDKPDRSPLVGSNFSPDEFRAAVARVVEYTRS